MLIVYGVRLNPRTLGKTVPTRTSASTLNGYLKEQWLVFLTVGPGVEVHLAHPEKLASVGECTRCHSVLGWF